MAEAANGQKQNMSLLKILSQTVKTGIIRSNLIPMFAGLTLSLYTYQIGILEKLPEILFAFLGSIFVIGAAGAFNNLYDRDIDAIMKRTQGRPTVTGEIRRDGIVAGYYHGSGRNYSAFPDNPAGRALGFSGIVFLCCSLYYVEQAENSI